MNKIVLLLPLLLLMTTTLAWATNESSYKEGFNNAFDGYNCVQTEDCDIIANNGGELICNNQLDNPHVSNSTACIDGYVDGWKHWCNIDMKDCLADILVGYFPDVNHVLQK
jgi:hypothetical protein